jgi:hypothetical protein
MHQTILQKHPTHAQCEFAWSTNAAAHATQMRLHRPSIAMLAHTQRTCSAHAAHMQRTCSAHAAQAWAYVAHVHAQLLCIRDRSYRTHIHAHERAQLLRRLTSQLRQMHARVRACILHIVRHFHILMHIHIHMHMHLRKLMCGPIAVYIHIDIHIVM